MLDEERERKKVKLKYYKHLLWNISGVFVHEYLIVLVWWQDEKEQGMIVEEEQSEKKLI